jgi:hypothetical protein
MRCLFPSMCDRRAGTRQAKGISLDPDGTAHLGGSARSILPWSWHPGQGSTMPSWIQVLSSGHLNTRSVPSVHKYISSHGDPGRRISMVNSIVHPTSYTFATTVIRACIEATHPLVTDPH